MARKNNNPFWKVILTDLAGVGCLILVPFLGPLPGPGGIPLLIAGFGLLAVNHDWADNAVEYIKKNSESLRAVLFPDKIWVKWVWDMGVLLLSGIGLWLNLNAEGWLLKGFSIGLMATASTLFMLNRDRISWLQRNLRISGKR